MRAEIISCRWLSLWPNYPLAGLFNSRVNQMLIYGPVQNIRLLNPKIIPLCRRNLFLIYQRAGKKSDRSSGKTEKCILILSGFWKAHISFIFPGFCLMITHIWRTLRGPTEPCYLRYMFLQFFVGVSSLSAQFDQPRTLKMSRSHFLIHPLVSLLAYSGVTRHFSSKRTNTFGLTKCLSPCMSTYFRAET